MEPQARHPTRWLALGLIALAQFMVIMDTSIIGVALPEIQADLGFTQESLSWVFNAYVIAFGGLLLLGGRLSDLFGARRVFTVGWAVLAVGSLIAGLAGGVGAELVGRGIQGVGAALIAPSALTLLMILFGSEPKELTKALALYGAAAPAGGTAGVFLGGVITEWISWPWVFFINIPIALAVLVLTPRVMPATPRRRGSIDVPGAVAVTAGLALAVFGIVRAPVEGWGSAETLGVLAGAVALIGVFVALQDRRREPLVRLAIFRTPNLAAANMAQLLLGAAWIPMWFFLNLYLQQVLGYGAFEGGSALLPMTLAIMGLMVVVAPRVIARFGFKAPIVAGLLVLAAGLAGLSLARPDGTLRRRRAAGVARRGGGNGARVHPLARHGDLQRPSRGGWAGVRHRQHQLSGGLSPRPGSDDRPGDIPGRRSTRKPRGTDRRILGRVHRRGRRSTRRRSAGLHHSAAFGPAGAGAR